MYGNGFIKCDYCTKTIQGASVQAGEARWEWATGTGETKHACNKCKTKPEWSRDKSRLEAELRRAYGGVS